MSIKINKNGKEYDLGFIPQSLYDDVANIYDDVESFTPTANSGCTITTVHNAFTKKVGHLRYIYLDVTIDKSSDQPQIKLPFTCAHVYMDISAMSATKFVDAVIRDNILYASYEDATPGSNRVRCSGIVMC